MPGIAVDPGGDNRGACSPSQFPHTPVEQQWHHAAGVGVGWS
jgi:hypothetical protein